MLLSLDTREVGRVTVVHCKGRIIGGRESESLRAHLSWLLHTRRSFVLHLGEVGFIDSSGLGTMVRALTSTRQARGELKLCNVPDFVRKVLQMSRLMSVFDVHDSEEKAVEAFYGPGARAEAPVPKGRSILCLDSNADVLAYLRELLHHAGYDVQSSMRVSDAMLLMRIEHFDLLLVGPDMTASPAKPPAFQSACAKLPVIELGSDFSTSDAGEAGARLLERVEATLASKAV
ncbi:MAG TPA: STAS domain-containing protein [Terriglobales bacterium]|nr:STAS domain-containing protein [Terriglobales bacterium]